MKQTTTMQRIAIVLLLATTHTLFAQTNVVVTLNNGTATSYSVENADKLYFSNNNLVITESTTLTQISLSSIRKVTFPSSISGIQTTEKSNELALYPNPAKDVIFIENLTSNDNLVAIYSMSGSLVSKQTLSSNAVNISALPRGLYIMKINNNVLKFSKL